MPKSKRQSGRERVARDLGRHKRHAEVPPECEVATVLSPRLSTRNVAEIVERLYLDATTTIAERIEYAAHPRRNPYPPTRDWPA